MVADTCNSRGLSWLVRSCMPDPNPITPEPRRHSQRQPQQQPTHHYFLSSSCSSSAASPLFSLPDDLLIECLSRLPSSSLPTISLVCRRFSILIDTPAFLHSRHYHGLVRRYILAVSVSDIGLLSSASHPAPGEPDHDRPICWEVMPYPLPLPSDLLVESTAGFSPFSHARLTAVGRLVYVLGRSAAIRYDIWTEAITTCSPTIYPRKKFATAAIGDKIYVAGGTARSASVEEYDPKANKWKIISEAPRKRYGCIGAATNGVFYVIGGLKIGTSSADATSAHVYASTMDAYDVTTGNWLRTRAVPGGGCIVAACASCRHVYVIASHAVEVSFWRWEEKKKSTGRRRGVGEWKQLRPPPVPGQVRVGGALRFACIGVGESKVVVVMHVSDSSFSSGSRRIVRTRYDGNEEEGWRKEGVMLWYDIGNDEWSRGMDLPAAFRRTACVCVDC